MVPFHKLAHIEYSTYKGNNTFAFYRSTTCMAVHKHSSNQADIYRSSPS